MEGNTLKSMPDIKLIYGIVMMNDYEHIPKFVFG